MVLIETELTEQHALALQRDMLKHTLGWYALSVAIFVGLLVYLSCNYALTPQDARDSFDIALIVIACLVVVFMTALYVYAWNGGGTKKKNAMLFGSRESYAFGSVAFTDVTVNTRNGVSGTKTLPYRQLHVVRETKNYFFLYLNMQTAHVLPKSDIVSGSVEELRGLLAPYTLPPKRRHPSLQPDAMFSAQASETPVSDENADPVPAPRVEAEQPTESGEMQNSADIQSKEPKQDE